MDINTERAFILEGVESGKHFPEFLYPMTNSAVEDLYQIMESIQNFRKFLNDFHNVLRIVKRVSPRGFQLANENADNILKGLKKYEGMIPRCTFYYFREKGYFCVIRVYFHE